MSILDTLRQRELQSLDKSVQGSECFEQRTKAHAENAKQLLSGKDSNPGVPVEVIILRDLYYHMLEDYKRERQVFNIRMNKRSVALWTRVENTRKKTNCSPERFLKAQFDWFHKKFGTAPGVEQLATEGAVERTFQYTGSDQGRVVGNNTKHKSSLADKFRQNEKLLQEMMRAQNCTREEFYKDFVLTGIYSFSREFLEADPVYRKVAGIKK